MSPGWRTPLRTLRERGLVERIEMETGKRGQSHFSLEAYDRATHPDRKHDSDPFSEPTFSPNDEQQLAVDALLPVDGVSARNLGAAPGHEQAEDQCE